MIPCALARQVPVARSTARLEASRIRTMTANGSAPSCVYPCVTDEVLELVASTPPVTRADGRERLGALFEAHHLRLYRLARRMTTTVDEARDLVQDAYVRAAGRLDGIPANPAAEEAWLVRVLVNLCRDRWRRQIVRRRFSTGQARPAAPVVTATEAALVARATVWQALGRLTPRRRAAIVMHEIEGEPVSEVARVLGVSQVTVRWHLSRGRKELARLVGPDLPGRER
jgi:RNA polymerase sigma-70 factor (ECF subfamily)